jgi:hypothetical protein
MVVGTPGSGWHRTGCPPIRNRVSSLAIAAARFAPLSSSPMTDPSHALAKMRQAVEDAGMVPSEAALKLLGALIATRPWQDENRTARAIRDWADHHWGEGSLTPRQTDGAADVAGGLSELGRLAPPLTDAQILGAALFMLRNVARSRAPTEDDPLRDHVVGLPARTARRYRQHAREAGLHPGRGGLGLYVRDLQYDIDLAALVHGGRSVHAARRWLERHPHARAKDAPPPRPRRASRTNQAGR